MAQVLVRDVEPAVVDRLKQRAKESGRSLEAELRLILEEATRHTNREGWDAAQRVRALFAGRTFSNSTDLIREDRERQASGTQALKDNLRRVVDASVAIKQYVPEVHDVDALRLLDSPFVRLAPDLLPVEVSNIVWKRERRGEATLEEAQAVMTAFSQSAINIVPSVPLLPLALELAVRAERSVYDSLYLALAVQENAQLVTADLKFYNALRQGPLASHVIWVEDV